MVQQNKRGQKKVSNFTDSEKISAQENIKMSSSNKNLQLIIKLSGTGTWEWNIQTGETIFNESWANMLGYKFEELMPTTIDTWTQMTHPDDLKIAQTALEKYFNKETAFYEAKFRMRHRNGNWVWVLDRGQVAEYTPDGKPLLMLGTHQNINKIKETEISLQLEEERLESLLRISQHQANTVQELLDYVLDEAIALTNSKLGYIYFYSEEKKEFTLNTWSKEVMQQCHVIDPQTIYKLEKTGIWGEAVRQRKPIVVNDFTAPNPLKKGIPEGHAPLQKFLIIPVFDQKKIVAVVGVANKPDAYSKSDIRQLTLMMDSVWKIVQRKEDSQQLQKANRLYAVISQVNQAIVHSKNRQKLFDEICRVAIDFGQFRMAWIGLLNSTNGKVEPASVAGEENGYLSEMVNINLDKKSGGSGPVGISIRTNNYFLCNDIATDPAMKLWREGALKRGYQSVIALPLRLYNKAIASLAIYSEQRNFFNSQEVKLLEEVAYDINYALDALETEAERKKAEHMANERLKELSAFYKLAELNEETNLSIDDLYNRFILFFPESFQYNQAAFARLKINNNEYVSENYKGATPWMISSPIFINNTEAGFIETGYNQEFPIDYEGPFLREERMLIDGIAKRLSRITERFLSEEKIVESEEKFRNLVNQMQLGMAVHEIILDDNGTPIDYRFLDCNPAFEKLTGFKRENILGKTVLEVLPATEKIWIEKYGQVALSGQATSFESYASELDKHYNVTAYQPQAMQFAVITEDVTTQKQTLISLKKSYDKFKLLSKAANEMLLLENPNDIYNYISELLHQQYPNAVILFQKVDEETKKSKLIYFKGADSSLINKAIQLTGFDFTKIEFNLADNHLQIFKSGNFCEFKKGLADFSGSQIPAAAAKAIEKLLGIKQIYTIGINKDEKLFATIHFLNKGAAITDNEFIELFIKQSGIIIDRMQTAKLLAEREEKYRLITENASDVIWVINLTTQKFTYISPTVELLRGYTATEAMAQTLEESVTPESFIHIQNALKQNLQKFLSNELNIEYYIDEIQQPCKDGRIIWVEVSTKFRINKHGEIEVVGVSRNIDERKKMEAAIRENEEKFRLLFKNSPLGIYIANTKGQIEDANPALLSILGSPSLEHTKQINVLQLPALVQNGYANHFKNCIEQNKVISIELPYTTHWGKKVHLSSYLVPLCNPKGVVEKVYTLMENITERKRNEKALIESEVRLKDALATKDKFFSIISHDLRSPFSTLVSFTDLMSNDSSHFSVDEYKHYAKAINKTAQSTFTLLENLLQWANLQRGSISFNPTEIDINNFVNSFDPALIEKMKAKQIKFETHIDEKMNIWADENMLHGIMRNLVSNAIKFTPKGGNIWLSISKTDKNETLFTIRDTGIGMPNHILENLFTIAEKTSRPGTDNEPSSGLGLILCKEFIEKHGGRIWAESDADGLSGQKGSTFYFTIPIKNKEK